MSEGYEAVVLLDPASHELPFALCLEFFSSSHRPQQRLFSPVVAAARRLAAAAAPSRGGITTDVLQLQLVLSGHGQVTLASGAVRDVGPGHSLIRRHRAGEHVTAPPMCADCGTNGSSSSSPLCVLSTYLPTSVLTAPNDAASWKAAQMLMRGLPWRDSPSVGVMSHEEASHVIASPAAWTSPPTQPPPPLASTREQPSSGDAHPSSSSNMGQAASAAATIAAQQANVSQRTKSGSRAGGSNAPPPPPQQPQPPPQPDDSLLLRSADDLRSFELPNQTNRVAFILEPGELGGMPLSAGLEVFQPGHVTPLHTHQVAHEVFFILSGTAVAQHGPHITQHGPGDVVVVPPGVVHGLHNSSATSKLFCVQMMLPDEQFARHVMSGRHVGRLSDEELCTLFATHCAPQPPPPASMQQEA